MDLVDVQPPFNAFAEDAALGAAILKAGDKEWLKKYTSHASGWDFYDGMNGWTWERLKWYANRGSGPLEEWIGTDGWIARFNQAFGPSLHERLPMLIVRWIGTGFWWHADYYLDVVLEMAKMRRRMIEATDRVNAVFTEAIELQERRGKVR